MEKALRATSPESASPLWSKTAKVSPCFKVRGRRSCRDAVAGMKNCATVAAGSADATDGLLSTEAVDMLPCLLRHDLEIQILAIGSAQ